MNPDSPLAFLTQIDDASKIILARHSMTYHVLKRTLETLAVAEPFFLGIAEEAGETEEMKGFLAYIQLQRDFFEALPPVPKPEELEEQMR